MFSGVLGKKNERFPCVRVGSLSSRSHFCLRIVGSTIGQMRFQTVHNLTNGRDHLILLIFESFEEHVLRRDDESGCYVRISRASAASCRYLNSRRSDSHGRIRVTMHQLHYR